MKEVEEVLIKSGKKFSLSKKKELYEDSSDTEYVSIDVTEIEIQRPKKAKILLFRQKEKAYNKSSNSDKSSIYSKIS